MSAVRPRRASADSALGTASFPDWLPCRSVNVAAHAWDLRGAQRLGLRTAYIARPVGDPPTSSDRFDLHADDLADKLDKAQCG